MAKKYSYIRYPYSRNGWYSFTLSILSLVLTAGILTASVMKKGQTEIMTGILGFTAAVFCFMGLWFAAGSLMERKKNRLFSYIGGGISLVLCAVWALIIVSGRT